MPSLHRSAPGHPSQRIATLLLVFASLLSACGGGDKAAAPTTFATLNGAQPIVIAHRGASGYYPEDTLEAYTLAIATGADVIEPDIVVTKDGVLIARHDVTLLQSTTGASRPEFASRKRAGENGDGGPVAADRFIADFTLAEIKTLGATSPNHIAAQRYNGFFAVATLQEILDLIKSTAQQTDRNAAVLVHFRLDVDGVFSDFADTALERE